MKIFKILPFLLCFAVFFELYSQKQIMLNAEKMSFSSAFRIDNVKDERSNKDNIGSIFISMNEKETIALKGGTVVAVKKMLLQSIPANNASILNFV